MQVSAVEPRLGYKDILSELNCVDCDAIKYRRGSNVKREVFDDGPAGL